MNKYYYWDYMNKVGYWDNQGFFICNCANEKEAIRISKELNLKLKEGIETPHIVLGIEKIKKDSEERLSLEEKIELEEKLREETGWL